MTAFNEIKSMSHFGFIGPQALWSLLVIPILLFFMYRIRQRRASYVVTYTNLAVLTPIVESRHAVAWRRWVPLILLVLALVSCATALARPRATLIVPEQNATVILLADVSGSMAATDVKPTRIAAATASMRVFLKQLPSQFRVGLMVFSSTPEILVYPTQNRSQVEHGLDTLIPQEGTAFGDGLIAATRLAVNSLKQRGVTAAQGDYLPAAIVVESDGKQNQGHWHSIAASAVAARAGVRIYGVALGTSDGVLTYNSGVGGIIRLPVPPDFAAVQDVARYTGGQAFAVDSASGLDSVYKSLGSSIIRKPQVREITSWFAAAAALLLASGIGIARLWGAALP